MRIQEGTGGWETFPQDPQSPPSLRLRGPETTAKIDVPN